MYVLLSSSMRTSAEPKCAQLWLIFLDIGRYTIQIMTESDIISSYSNTVSFR